MLRAVFDPESPFWRGIGKFFDVLVLSLLWLFLSLPVVTLGAATAALYHATVSCVLGSRPDTVTCFWEVFRRELKSGALATLCWGGVCALLVWGVWAVRARVAFEGVTAVALLAVWVAVLLVPVGALCWMFPLLSRFEFSTGGLIATALRLALGYLPRTVVIVAAALAGVVLSSWLLVPMLVLPCLAAAAWAKVMEPVFAKYR